MSVDCRVKTAVGFGETNNEGGSVAVATENHASNRTRAEIVCETSATDQGVALNEAAMQRLYCDRLSLRLLGGSYRPARISVASCRLAGPLEFKELHAKGIDDSLNGLKALTPFKTMGQRIRCIQMDTSQEGMV